MHDTLINLAMRIALRGVWPRWKAQTPNGTEVELGPDTFVGCGDPVAEMLGLLTGQVQGRIAEIAWAESKPQSIR